VAEALAQKRIIRVLCDKIISLERKRTEPLALILRDKYLFGKAKLSWNRSVASASASGTSATVKISPTRNQIADIRAKRFQRSSLPAAAGAGAGASADQ